jgi:hypothetical protein
MVYATDIWRKSKGMGLAKYEKGKIIEEYIFNYASSFDVKNTHPITGERLLRVPWPSRQGAEIADIMIYSDKYLVVIESKSWDAISVESLEVELKKFEKNVSFIKDNLEQLSFDKKLSVIALFYTPYPQFHDWKGIILVPSLFSLGTLLLKYFNYRKPVLLQTQYQESVLTKIRQPCILPMDASKIDQSFESNRFRIQDGVFDEIYDNDVTVWVINPNGWPLSLVVEIDEEGKNQLREKTVHHGDVIRMLLYNLNGVWSLVQMIAFMILDRSPDKAQLELGDLTTNDVSRRLFAVAPNEITKDIIAKTWGRESADNMADYLLRHKIDIIKLLQRFHAKGQDPFTGMSRVLSMEAPNTVILQCECGEVFWLDSDAHKKIKKLRTDILHCKNCDPTLLEDLAKV